MDAAQARSATYSEADPALEELREAYTSGSLVVFAGSAISTSAGLPSWARLAALLAEHPRMSLDRARREELLGALQHRRLVDALTVAEQVLGPAEFGALVERYLNDQDLPVPPLARAIAALAPRLKAVLTTNIDHLLERAFAYQWPTRDKEHLGIVQGRAFILKLHGTLLERSSWVFTRADYDYATWGHGSIRETFARFFQSVPLLFVGHELNGEDFEGALAQVRALAGSHPPRHFALVPVGSIQGMRRQNLEGAGIRLIEYSDADGQHSEAIRILESLAGAERVDSPSPGPGPTAPERSEQSPFPGLECFDEDRAHLFFGRETERAAALQLLGETPRGHMRWLQVEGASGTGKSSFVRAGLLPKVRAGWVNGAPRRWRVAVLRPGRQPLLSLAQAVLSALRPPGASLEELVQQMRGSRTALASFLRQHTPPEHGFLLLIDQFEELFTLADGESRATFDRSLAEALADTSGPLYLMTAVRGDFLGHLGELPELRRLLPEAASRYTLAPMGRIGLQAAIQRPAQSAGLHWESGLSERLLEELSGIESSLPLLAHALRELWAARSGQVLTHAAHDTLGGSLGALTRSADRLVESLGSKGSERARRLLLALVTLQGGKASRRSLTRAEALAAAGGDDEAEQVLARLSGGRGPTQPETAAPPVRLVVVSQTEGQDRIDLVHEALLTRWTTLGKWLEVERQALTRRDDLEAAARSWLGAGSPRRDLPSGAHLAYLRTGAPVTELARLFLAQAVARERVRKRSLYALMALLIAGLATMSVLAFYALHQQDMAEQQTALAQKRLEEAVASVALVNREVHRRLTTLGGTAAARRELLKSNSQLLDNLYEGAQDNPAVLQARMETHRITGDYFRDHDNLTSARKEYEAARDIAQRLGHDTELAINLTKLGDVVLPQGLLDEAHSFFQRAYELRQALASADPSNAMLQRDLSVALTRLGSVAQLQGRLNEAIPFFEQSLEITQALANADPSDETRQRDLAVSLTKLGDVAQQQGRLDVARDYFRRVLALTQALAKALPYNTSLQRDLSVSLNRLGDVEQQQDRLDEARDYFQRALELREALAREDSSNSSLKRDMSICLSKLGNVAQRQNRLDEARAFFLRDVAIIQGLAQADPSNVQLTLDWAAAELSLAMMELKGGNPRAMQAHRANAEKILDGLRQHPQIARQSRYQQLRDKLATLPR